MAKSPSSGTKGKKIKWSNLYSFSCFMPNTNIDPDVTTDEQPLIGQQGFSRVVFCNESQLHKVEKSFKYPSNYISTTKYNLVSYLPKALFEQFRRVANFYFLLAAVLSMTTSVAPVKPISLVAPLVFVVGISMLKEAVEDWYRFLQVKKLDLVHQFYMFRSSFRVIILYVYIKYTDLIAMICRI